MATRDRLRVVVTGHAGLEKGDVLARLCQYIYSQDPAWQAVGSNPEYRQRVEKSLAQVYEAETDLDMLGFLELGWRDQQRLWRRSVSRAIARWEKEDPRYAFFSIHLSYQWHSGFFSPFSWRIEIATDKGEEMEDSLLRFIRDRFKPDYCVALIDDIQAVQHRIAPGIHIRLRELLTWRNFEILLTDFLAKEAILKIHPDLELVGAPFEYSPVVAIRHPPEMLYRLLAEPECLRIYASYPISRTRDKHRDEIDRFRVALNTRFTVYDPLTIDERPLQKLLKDYREHSSNVPALGQQLTLAAEDRWFIPAECTLCGEEPKEILNFEVNEIDEITRVFPGEKTEIDRTIEARDFRLIDQSDCLVVYRPQFQKGELSGGTEAEIRYAKNTQKRVFLIHDPVADGLLNPETFDVEFLGGPYRLDHISNLSDLANQGRVLEDLIKRLNENASALVARRTMSL